MTPRIERPDATAARALISDLTTLTLDVVAGGASVNFMADVTRKDLDVFWRGMIDKIANGHVHLFLARGPEGVDGCVLLMLVTIPNQPHRAEISKLLVHRRARRKGLAELLMRAAEAEARSLGRTLLTLDTVQGSTADRLYRRLGYVEAGPIPNYALFPDGTPCTTVVFWKAI